MPLLKHIRRDIKTFTNTVKSKSSRQKVEQNTSLEEQLDKLEKKSRDIKYSQGPKIET